MGNFSVGIIGTGRPRNSAGATGFGMAHLHAAGYAATGNCTVTALADIVKENADTFNQEKLGGNAAVFTDYHEMLRTAKPDIVSVCTIPALHAPMVIAAAEAGVKAIHCEKPMAGTFGEARRMAEAAKANGVQLTFNHQRRFNNPFQTAKRLLNEGAIGKLVRIEGACGDMLDWGTHWLNMFLFYNDEQPAVRVMGQIDARHPKKVFQVPMETQAMSLMEFANGVTGLLLTGEGAHKMMGCENRLIGTEGMLEIHNDAPNVRLRRKDDTELKPVEDGGGGIHGDAAITLGIKDLVEALETGRTPLLDVTNALRTTEIIFATYESARRRGRIDLPLTIDDSPLVDLLNQGVFPAAVA
ncbi:MAG: Gfo/Idh/MocA family oxidoreductase [Capsulimonadales bacterium]|nr:Gfo/Idh/MocA family oxidoreductase [Capsulimonadales bacterium]